MDVVYRVGQMGLSIMVIGRIMQLMVMECSTMLMVIYLRDNGVMIKLMAMVYILI